jgi:acylphosphatase
MTSARRCLVSGQVQGVWYRDTTRRKAMQLGVSGSAVNLPDGRVEVIACGDPEALQALCDWLWEGSELSQVTAVECEAIEPFPARGFHIG